MQGLKGKNPETSLPSEIKVIDSTEFTVYKGVPRDELPKVLEGLGADPQQTRVIATIKEPLITKDDDYSYDIKTHRPNFDALTDGQWVVKFPSTGILGLYSQITMGNATALSFAYKITAPENILRTQILLPEEDTTPLDRLARYLAPAIILQSPNIRGPIVLQPELTTPVPPKYQTQLITMLNELTPVIEKLCLKYGIITDLTGLAGVRKAVCMQRKYGRLPKGKLRALITNAGVLDGQVYLFDALSFFTPRLPRRLRGFIYNIHSAPQIKIVRAALSGKALDKWTYRHLSLSGASQEC